MLQSLGEYASRITSLANLGMLTAIGGAYRAYLGSLPEGKLAEWIARRSGQMDVYRTRGSLIFTIPMVLQASVITVYGAVAIAIGATAAPSLEAWRVAVLLLLGLVMVRGSWIVDAHLLDPQAIHVHAGARQRHRPGDAFAMEAS